MPDDLMWRYVDKLDDALETLGRTVEQVRSAYGQSAAEVKADGTKLGEILARRGVGDRRRLEVAIRVTQASLRRVRAHVVRTLVDEEGMTITAVAQLMGISRQAVSALYQEAINE